MLSFKVVDFKPEVFGGWERFASYMDEYYVKKPWFFGYKCLNCDKDNFEIVNNFQEKKNCSVCGKKLVSFFEPNRTKRYFSKPDFVGKVIMHDEKPIGWILGFKERVRNLNPI